MSTKVIADCINGNFVVDSFEDYEGCMVLGEQDFYDELSTLSEESIIGAELSDAMYKKIDNEYGINE